MWAHPRSRGENAPRHVTRLPGLGSSPLTRGKQARNEQTTPRHRLIPAHAGKTTRSGQRRTRCRAHPRSRGENAPSERHGVQPVGSSPLTRGKRSDQSPGAMSLRLIPAHAGKTWCGRVEPVRVAAHPRSRGENGWVDLERIADSGSSPLTRGKLWPGCPFFVV